MSNSNSVVSSSYISTVATMVFGSVECARTWLNSPNATLGFQAPADVATSPAGAEKVMNLLNQRKSLVKAGVA